MTNLLVYMIGILIVAGALAYGASRLGVSQTWILVGVLLVVGLGLMGGITKTRQKEPAD